MAVNQIYTIVNAAAQQAFGNTALAAIDTQGLIALGNKVLSSSADTEAFLNALTMRIGRTVVRYRMYRNKLADMVLGDMEWGAIMQKLAVRMPTAETDEQYGLVDGQSVDHYKVAKPSVDQKLFIVQTPYQFHVTIQRNLLRTAFLSESGMASLISAIFGQIRNKIETSIENLGRLNIAAGVAEASGAGQVVNLVTEYNTASGRTLTSASAMLDSDFLRYALRRIKEVMDGMTDMSSMYNDGTLETFTPYEDQRIRIISSFEYALETVVEWAAFNEDYVRLAGFSKLNFWQAQQSPMSINIEKPSDGSAFTLNNLIAVIHDRDAMGVYQTEEEVATTPLNAAALYYNQYYHRMDNRMLDTSENLVYFTLN